MLYIFLVKENIVKENLMSSFTLPKRDKKLPIVLSQEEMIEILDGIIVCVQLVREIDVWLNCYMQRVCVFQNC